MLLSTYQQQIADYTEIKTAALKCVDDISHFISFNESYCIS